MKVAIIGSGGREHAICKKISESSKVSKIYVLPGNAGISSIAECVHIEDISGIANFCCDENIDLVFIGPEAPLSKGIVDTLHAKNIKVIGPDMKASILESSKIWAKEFMFKYNIPTAKYTVVSSKQELLEEANNYSFPLVVKIDGLCSGKGVFICNDSEELNTASESIYENITQGTRIIIEEYLCGVEASFMIFTDGEAFLELATSKDHKKIYEGEKGPNTGGMGAYSPANISDELYKNIIKNIVYPTIDGINNESLNYKGVLYFGLMIMPDNSVKVLEYNVRLGDPEAQAILSRMDSDIMDILIPLSSGMLPVNYKIKWKKEYSVCIVLAQNGYPYTYKKGVLINNLKNYINSKNSFIYHAGTVLKEDSNYYTNGGRVLGVCALGKTLNEAKITAYKELEKIVWDEAVYRTDIGVN